MEIFQAVLYGAMMSETPPTLGARIREARIDKRMTQQALAGMLNVSVQSVSQWEMDRTQPTMMRLFDLAEILGVTTEWLSKGAGERLSRQFEYAPVRKRLADLKTWRDLRSIRIFGSDLPPDEEITEHSILAEKPAVRQLFAIRIEEEDNAPTFSIGDLVIADTGVKARPGDFVFVELGSEDDVVFRQLRTLRRNDDGSLAGELRPLNPDYPTEQITLDEQTDFMIGVMVEHRRFRRN